MSKILAVLGATGQQGGSLIDYVLNDPELSKQFKIRAITRDVNSEKSKLLKSKVEVVQGDLNDRASIHKAFRGAHTAFGMTNPTFTPDSEEVEYSAAKLFADAAVEEGLEYIIFSTLPSVKEIAGSKTINAPHFDAKARAEQYMRGLKIKSAFFSPGFFMQNFHNMPFMVPQKTTDDTWVFHRANSPQSKLPFIDVRDTGKYVGAILAEPDKYEGKTFCASTRQYTPEETASIMSKATGKNVVFKQVSEEQFKEELPFAGDIFVETFRYPEQFGYYGPDSDALVEWAANNARGKVNTFEEYLKAHPLQLA